MQLLSLKHHCWFSTVWSRAGKSLCCCTWLVPGLRAPSVGREPPVMLMGALQILPGAKDSPCECLRERLQLLPALLMSCLYGSCCGFFLQQLSGRNHSAVPRAEEKQETPFSVFSQLLVPLTAIRVGSHSAFLLWLCVHSCYSHSTAMAVAYLGPKKSLISAAC